MRGWSLLAIALALFTAAGSAQAQYQDWVGPGGAIEANYYDTDFTVGGTSYDTNVTRLGFVFGEHFTSDFALMLGAGYMGLGMGGNAVAAPFSLTGYYAKAGGRYDPALFSDRFGLSFRFGADYQRVNDSTKGSELVDHWWSYMGAVGPWIRVNAVTFEGGIVYRHASGQQELSGQLNSTEDLGYANSTNPYLGLIYHPNVDWSVGLHLEGGGRKSATLGLGYHFATF